MSRRQGYQMMFDSISDRVEQRLGNYRLLRLLVRLSFADVYLGEHVSLNNPVVLRVFRIALLDKDSEDFLREAQILASLDHPHIVRILDVAVEGGVPYVVIDNISHKTLRHRHPPGTRLAPDTIVAYLKHIASALRYVHDQNFIHRNVQPRSMLLGV